MTECRFDYEGCCEVHHLGNSAMCDVAIAQREQNGLVCARCGARFPMPGVVYDAAVIHLDSGRHEVRYVHRHSAVDAAREAVREALR